jgi:hypothetical protein
MTGIEDIFSTSGHARINDLAGLAEPLCAFFPPFGRKNRHFGVAGEPRRPP